MRINLWINLWIKSPGIALKTPRKAEVFGQNRICEPMRGFLGTKGLCATKGLALRGSTPFVGAPLLRPTKHPLPSRGVGSSQSSWGQDRYPALDAFPLDLDYSHFPYPDQVIASPYSQSRAQP